MRYHNFNVLQHAIPYICTQFSLVLGYLQRATTRYRQIYKKSVYWYLKKNKMTVTCGNPLQIIQNQANLRENIW